MKFGAHCSTAGGVWKALERCQQISGESCQIFVKNNMQWSGQPHAADHLAQFKRLRAEGKFHAVFGHTGYLINLGSTVTVNRDKSLESLIQEIQLADALEIPFLVLHPGAHLGKGEAEGIKQII